MSKNKDEFARFFNGVPLNIAQRGKNRCRAATRRTSVVPSDHDFFFCQLKRKRVNLVSRQIAAVSFGEICVSVFHFLRKQNRAFAPAHPICRKALAGKVNAARILAVCPEKARRRGKPAVSGKAACPWGCPQITEISFISLKEIS